MCPRPRTSVSVRGLLPSERRHENLSLACPLVIEGDVPADWRATEGDLSSAGWSRQAAGPPLGIRTHVT